MQLIKKRLSLMALVFREECSATSLETAAKTGREKKKEKARVFAILKLLFDLGKMRVGIYL